ncbi:4-hydroxyphenylpyruvate dioxygenase [Anabaena sp. FACHB-709]|uniref:4-hydroxyphenylpyruvate dioxygenase n=2 Tax=Nostocaceae TaxID=1162 RepID=A0A1Z4KRX0_ANAVA|nr:MULTISPECIES: 4-hydroxyphenylpyruvate dioxygenase [Nostocaceae]BAY71746.1 4-hydroxyphenylpyruvate dioxygenase [Trichormus variabilis NIES-23]HBW33653.1 4-hydroxyphenylpyruvate dioxygenase [Nostoc sp. UBA8866]MBD2172347.1 4-hydroxyphenylpyruvate dioxygenase [Anabaena cylindrica FACHB-318]MBD2263832.1 4-hydroxyphenylpyruvate dioxygenase [Anabaena sp. FACHB-709]MBD2273287.1 4-hydroxyphenylpyruvate dioxygenase [Nostoc sp. PCC 7120 = FACHB-418]
MKIDHVHFYVEDAKVWRDWFLNYLGFTGVSSNIGSLHTCTEVVQSGDVCFLLSSPLLSTSPVAEFLRQHPPGVSDVAFAVEDVEVAIAHAQAHGATILQPIGERQIGNISRQCGKIAAWGGLTHTLIEKLNSDNQITSSPNFITAIDHIVLNVAVGELEAAVAWYEKILDLQPRQAFKIQTDRSALHSQVMVSRDGSVQLPINEPASSNSQIQEFLNFNRGAGIQHIALQTQNIVDAIAQFRNRGLPLLSVPQTYYTQLKQRLEIPLSSAELEAIAQQEILVDWRKDNQNGVLLQIFTQPIFAEPTFFLEFIERRSQAQGFGEGNFRALFEAIESEQMKRGTLQ